MSFEIPQDIPAEERVWVQQSSPRESWPPLPSGKLYGFLPDSFCRNSSEPIPSLEERRENDEQQCELTPGFEYSIREQRQLKQLSPTSSREVDSIRTKEVRFTVWLGLHLLTQKMSADGIKGFDGDFTRLEQIHT